MIDGKQGIMLKSAFSLVFAAACTVCAHAGTSRISAAGSVPSCFSEPTRRDNSWQNWIAKNDCGTQIEVRYEIQDSKGTLTKGVAFAGSCQETQILQTFKEDIVGGFSYTWDDSRVHDSCDKTNASTSTPAQRPARVNNIPTTDLSSLIADQQIKAQSADAVNQDSSDEIDDLNERRRKFNEAKEQQARQQQRIQQQQNDEAANEFIGNVIIGLKSVAPSGGGGASGRARRGGGSACTYAQGCEAMK